MVVVLLRSRALGTTGHARGFTPVLAAAKTMRQEI